MLSETQPLYSQYSVSYFLDMMTTRMAWGIFNKKKK